MAYGTMVYIVEIYGQVSYRSAVELWNRKRYAESHRTNWANSTQAIGYLSSALRAIKTVFLMPFV